jgi:deazaflavin-dependent oxidoreductase (nitroreductase family)
VSPGRLRSRLHDTRIRAVLASPWHRRHSDHTLTLEVTGRRTGKRFRLPVSYVEDGGELLVFVDEADAKRWWRNLRGGATVRVRLRGQRRPAWAEVVWDHDPAALARALARFVAAWPGFVDLGLPPADYYSAEDLLPVARGLAVVMIRVD